MARRFLVTGGAGYVGSHLVAALVERGDSVVVLDNLRTGHRGAVPPKRVKLIVADLADAATVDARAGRRAVGRGVPFRRAVAGRREHADAAALPDRQWRERHAADRGLRAPWRRRVSCCPPPRRCTARPTTVPIPEDAPLDPESPYGDSKWFLERALLWAERVHGLRYASLRYFNAAGADPAGRFGEDHRPETHLIPLVIDAALGRRAGTRGLWRRLRDAGRHLPARLRACDRSGRGASASAGPAGSRQHQCQSRQRHRPFGAAGDRVRGARVGTQSAVPHRVHAGRAMPPCWWPPRNAHELNLAGGRASPTSMKSCAPRCAGARRTRTAMRTERRSATVASIALAATLLLWPAFWNGYPLVFADTGTYLSQAIEHLRRLGSAGLLQPVPAAAAPDADHLAGRSRRRHCWWRICCIWCGERYGPSYRSGGCCRQPPPWRC